MTHPKLSGEEITQRGKAHYEHLRAKVETEENIGKLIAVNVETGDYLIGDDLIGLSRHLQAKQSDAPIWAGRIGFNAVYAIGGTLIRTVQCVIHGTVIGLQARMNVILRLPQGSDLEVECVVDTGFEGFLTLPPAMIREFDLPYVARIDANLADDSSVEAYAYLMTIIWNGAEREVAVLGIGRRPLIGTALLEDCHLGIDFCEGGTVIVDDIL